jgi:hypothetical protein
LKRGVAEQIAKSITNDQQYWKDQLEMTDVLFKNLKEKLTEALKPQRKKEKDVKDLQTMNLELLNGIVVSFTQKAKDLDKHKPDQHQQPKGENNFLIEQNIPSCLILFKLPCWDMVIHFFLLTI